MYLKEILLENVASIDFLDLSLPFNDDGTPQPVIIVGVNGSGKSILLSYIADALIEFAKQAYMDIVPQQLPNMSYYFKICGRGNQKIGSDFSTGLLEFISNKETYCYLDKSGNIDPSSYIEKRKNRFEKIESWDIDGNEKIISPQNKQFFETCFYKNVFCYFPPNRNEFPHWLNRQGINQSPSFKLDTKLSGILNKPIYIESSIEDNKSWILDVFLDSTIDFEPIINQNNTITNFLLPTDKINDKIFLKKSRENVEKILQSIFQDDSIKLAVNYRNDTNSRLCLTKQGQIFIPSLDHLSSGQSILFNLFTTIIRYADKGDIMKSIELNKIEGIVIIDEIDVHLHSDLQYEILPKLIKLFPKVQFIVTTHSPLFILGMENEYQGKDFKVIEMPKGETITTERFSEFKTSFEYYKITKAFEDEVEYKIRLGNKPKVLTEGETDPIYITTALELLGHQDILEQVDIEWVGKTISKGRNINSGDTGLNHTKDVLIANPDFLNRKILLLYDCDTKKPNEDHRYLSVRCLSERKDAKVKKGIENLIPNELFEKRFYTKESTTSDYGEEKNIEKFQKKIFCQWICEERKNHDDFIFFQQVVEILQEFLYNQCDH